MENLEYADVREAQTPLASSRSLQQDPWNWKMPSRRDTMNLNTLTEKKDLMQVKKPMGLRTNRIYSANMNANDISKAQPKVHIPRDVNRATFYDNKDIDRAQPRQLHVKLEKHYSSMSNNDIAGSKP